MVNNLTVGEFLLQSVKDLGVKEIFGIPGDMVIRFFKVIEDFPDMDLYTFSHEPGVGFAAIGSSRGTQMPAVACITYGAGGLNMVNSVACAYAEKTPLIVISGGPGESEKIKNNLLHHVVKNFNSQLRVYEEVTQVAVMLDDPRTAYNKIKKALHACQEFMEPVYIEIPRDMVDEKIIFPEGQEDFSYLVDMDAIEEAADEIVQKIIKAERPMIFAGVESERFNLNKSVLELAEKLNLPIVTGFLSRDIIPQDHPNYFGTYVGLAGNPVARELVEGSDCLLMLGALITDMNLGIKLKNLNRENLILCVSREVIIKHHIYHNVTLKKLVEALLARKVEKNIVHFPKKHELVINRDCKFTDEFITTGEIIDAVNWFFNENEEMPIISDTGDCLFTTLKISSPMFMASAYYATMGFSVPASIGYMLTTGNRPLVLLGDGAFQMTGQEMSHCPRFGINPIFIVFNNRRWGMQQLFDPSAGFNELVNWPYAKIAEFWGGKGYFCDTCEKLYNALVEARDNAEFSVIEVFMEKEELSEELLAWLQELKAQA